MGFSSRYASFVTEHSRWVLLALLVATAVVGSAAADVDSSLSIAQFNADSEEAEALDAIEANFSLDGEGTTAMQVVVRDENALSKASLLSTLEYRQQLRANGTVAPTLAAQQPPGIATVVGTVLAQRGENGSASAPPSLDAQTQAMAEASPDEVEAAVERVLAPEAQAGRDQTLYAFLPTDYEPGATTADARVFLVSQTLGPDADPQNPSPALVDAQLAAESIATDTIGGESFVFGVGILDDESTRATGDSFAIIGPVALLLIVAILAIAYRDLLDVFLSLLGIVLVLVWTFGFMGWVGIGITQILIAVPFLLVGLAIDYGLHVVMRFREEADTEQGVRESMRLGLGGVVVAIGAATVTTAVGFAANVISPIPPIAEFGLVSAVGILASFVVFGAFLPALKVELDSLFSRVRRWDRPAFGTDVPAVSRVLGVGEVAARRAPVAILAIALILSAGGVYGAANTDTTFSQEAFLPRDAPDWMDNLPESFQPGDYDILANVEYLNENFLQFRDSQRVEVLVTGDVASPGGAAAIANGQATAAERNSTVVLSGGQAAVTSPLTVAETVGTRNETMAAALEDADTDGDGVPDRNVSGVYDTLFAVAPDRAGSVLNRSGGEYTAARLTVSVRGGVPPRDIADDARAVAAAVESGGASVAAIATGAPVLTAQVQAGLLTTLVEGFLITLGVILAFLLVLYRVRHGTAVLGVLTLLPVLAALAWILGTMYLLGINFTTETAIITSIAIGLGVDYSIHITERFVDERARSDDADAALRATVRGTGGALLGSAATTFAGFSVLSLALVPSLQRFGIVTGMTIVYAFVASVVVLPSILVLWERYGGTATSPAAEESDA